MKEKTNTEIWPIERCCLTNIPVIVIFPLYHFKKANQLSDSLYCYFFFGKSGFISKSSKRFKMTFTSNNTKLFGQYLVQDEMVMVEGNIDGGLTRKTTLLEVKETIEATTIDSDIK